MTARDLMKASDVSRGPKKTPPKRRPVVQHGITDHAVLRYLERVYGIDVERIRAAILTPENKRVIAKLGSGKFPLADGSIAVVVNEVVVTISPPR